MSTKFIIYFSVRHMTQDDISLFLVLLVELQIEIQYNMMWCVTVTCWGRAGRGPPVWRRRDDGAGVCGVESGQRRASHSGHPHPGQCRVSNYPEQLCWTVVDVYYCDWLGPSLACSARISLLIFMSVKNNLLSMGLSFLMFSISILRAFNVGSFYILILVFLWILSKKNERLWCNKRESVLWWW